MEWESHEPHSTHQYVMRSPTSSCALIMVLPFFVKLPWKTLYLDASGFGGTWKCKREMGRFVIVLNRPRGGNASFCCSWNLACSNANTSSLVRFVPTFTNHTLGIWPIKHPFFAPFHTSINVIYTKWNNCRNVVVGTVFLPHARVCWRRCAM